MAGVIDKLTDKFKRTKTSYSTLEVRDYYEDEDIFLKKMQDKNKIILRKDEKMETLEKKKLGAKPIYTDEQLGHFKAYLAKKITRNDLTELLTPEFTTDQICQKLYALKRGPKPKKPKKVTSNIPVETTDQTSHEAFLKRAKDTVEKSKCDEKTLGMVVSVHLISQSKKIDYTNVENTYTKDGLFCIYMKDKNMVHKYPVQNIFRVEESYR